MKEIKKLKEKLKKHPPGTISKIKRYIVSFRVVIFDTPLPKLANVEKISLKIAKKAVLKAFKKKFKKVDIGTTDIMFWDRQLLWIEDHQYNQDMKERYDQYSKKLIAKAGNVKDKKKKKKK